MKKFYLVCPKCWKVEEASQSSWEEVFEEHHRYYYLRDEEGCEDWKDADVLDSEHVLTKHSCGFETEGWRAYDFEVMVRDGKVVEAGDYWEREIEKAEEILKKAGIIG